MTDNNGIHSGSLQFYPRVRAKRVIPKVNWKPLKKESVGFMGFVGYKVGMISAWVKDNTEDSMTKGKRIAVPCTLIECPVMKIYMVRFYKGNTVLKDVIVSNDKILKKRVGVPKKIDKTLRLKIDNLDFDDVRVVMYSGVEKTGIGKKKVDLVEVGVSGDKEDKLSFIEENIGKEISIGNVFSEGLVDVRGVTKGYGTSGPVKRFGIAYKDHKSEKGQKRPGSLAPWHPARVTFRAPQAGQTGYFTRVCYNNMILKIGTVLNAKNQSLQENGINRKGGFKHYGIIKNDYLILKGSVPGPKKRGIFITQALRPTDYQSKKKFEVLELR